MRSTSFLGAAEMQAWIRLLDLRMELVTADPYAPDADYQIHSRLDGWTPEPREILFCGTLPRCGDFLRGYLMGASR